MRHLRAQDESDKRSKIGVWVYIPMSIGVPLPTLLEAMEERKDRRTVLISLAVRGA